ncbi:hypothetical protein MSPP1_002298 [Malassezia sp. CBS 17886]|nr:hypothetical protein MSPP1_002298 [Malassezia sp. CBS 17886]
MAVGGVSMLAVTRAMRVNTAKAAIVQSARMPLLLGAARGSWGTVSSFYAWARDILFSPHADEGAPQFAALGMPAATDSVPAAESVAVWDGLLLGAPKSRVSHSRKAMRAANKGLKDRVDLVHCPGCGRPKAQHHLCEHCYAARAQAVCTIPCDSRASSGAVRLLSTAAPDRRTHPPASLPDERIHRLIPPTKQHPLPRDNALAIVSLVSDHVQNEAPTLAPNAEAQVLQELDDCNGTAAALRKLANAVLQLSREATRYPVVGELYRIAYRRGDRDAGYSWATMILEGFTISQAREEAVQQTQAALDVYAKLAQQGHPNAQFGLGRVLLAKHAQYADGDAGQKGEGEGLKRAIALWQRAGQGGMPDAWYELGRLYDAGSFVPGDHDKAQTCFEQGARAGSTLASYALGVLHAERAAGLAAAHGDSASVVTDAASLSNRYLLRAAQRGHAPSAYNMGMRYLMQGDATGDASAREMHRARWGVLPDDASARDFFSAAAAKGFLPAMMNYGTMLVEGRGARGPRADDLAAARRVYERVVQMGERRARSAALPRDNGIEPVTEDIVQHMAQQARAALRRIGGMERGAGDGSPADDAPARRRACVIQ